MARMLGRLAPHPEDTHPRLKLAQFLRADALPPVPTHIDYMSNVADWPMYLNDQIGDCTCAAAGHMVEAATRYGQGTTVKVTDQDVLKAYEAVSGYDPTTGANDNGAVMQDVLNLWRKTGIGGHRILAFAQLDHTNLDQVYQALYLFGHVYVGVNFPQSAMDQFDKGQPWSVVTNDGGILGGHAINLGSRNNAALQVVTWGKAQGLDEAWWRRYVEEAWIAITPEWVNSAGSSPEGLDVAALNSAFQQLTGQPGPFPVAPQPGPTPPPVPPGPTPGPDPADLALVRALDPWAHTLHSGGNKTAAHAYLAWKQAKHL